MPDEELMDPRGGVFGTKFCLNGGSVSPLLVDPMNLTCDGGGLGGLLPYTMPIDRRDGGGPGTNNVKHEFGPASESQNRLKAQVGKHVRVFFGPQALEPLRSK